MVDVFGLKARSGSGEDKTVVAAGEKEVKGKARLGANNNIRYEINTF